MMTLAGQMLLDGHLAERTDTKHPTGTGSQKPLMQCTTESLAASQICLFHGCQLICGGQPLDHCWRNMKKKTQTNQD